MARSPALLVLALAVIALPALAAAELDVAARAEVKRGFAAVGSSSSEEPALRLERRSREPSPGFMLGTALGAWIGAASTLDYDLRNPSGDHPATGGVSYADAIATECFDERTALGRLETRRKALDLSAEQVMAAAGVADGEVLTGWRNRLAGPAAGC